jgi:hypothetical protein
MMRPAGTHFEQVPKAVVEKILAQQGLAAENEPPSVEAGKNLAGGKTQTTTKIRNPRP